jgi:hypothetical protein
LNSGANSSRRKRLTFAVRLREASRRSSLCSRRRSMTIDSELFAYYNYSRHPPIKFSKTKTSLRPTSRSSGLPSPYYVRDEDVALSTPPTYSNGSSRRLASRRTAVVVQTRRRSTSRRQPKPKRRYDVTTRRWTLRSRTSTLDGVVRRVSKPTTTRRHLQRCACLLLPPLGLCES